jgi:hypothetical protein
MDSEVISGSRSARLIAVRMDILGCGIGGSMDDRARFCVWYEFVFAGAGAVMSKERKR